MPTESTSELTTIFAQLHGMLLSDQDATRAVRQLAHIAHQITPAAVGAGVSLLDDSGTRLSTAATDTRVEAADAQQYALGLGPCLSAWATGEAQRVDDTTQDSRWARWQELAAEAGIRSVLSVPLTHDGRPLGALKVYATVPQAFGKEQERTLVLLSDAVGTLLGAAQDTESPVRLSCALQSALKARETIERATGYLMARERLDAEAALTSILHTARAAARPVAEVAASILGTGQGPTS